MAGIFEGLSNLEWKLFADLFPPEPTKRGHPPAPPRWWRREHVRKEWSFHVTSSVKPSGHSALLTRKSALSHPYHLSGIDS
jgi:hypothetical protein